MNRRVIRPMSELDHLLEVSVSRGRDDVDEIVDGIAFLQGSLGSEERMEGERIVRSLYFATAAERDAAFEALRAIEGVAVRATEREPVDWLSRYEQSLEPIEIGARFVVSPDRRLVDDTGARIPLIIPQEAAFGTGGHATTALCLELLESLGMEGGVGMDVGSGSGVLAIAMARLGCRSVVALDNDPEALPVLRRNLRRNGIAEGQVRSFCGTVDAVRQRRYDVVTVNILAEVIGPMFSLLAPLLSSNGRLVVSGILVAQSEWIRDAANAAGFALTRERAAGEWWAGVLEKA